MFRILIGLKSLNKIDVIKIGLSPPPLYSYNTKIVEVLWRGGGNLPKKNFLKEAGGGLLVKCG